MMRARQMRVKSRQKSVPQIQSHLEKTRAREMGVDTQCLPGAV